MKHYKTKAIDLTKVISPYTSGWVAVDKKYNVIAHAKDFTAICKKIRKGQDLLLIPASKSYFGFITITAILY